MERKIDYWTDPGDAPDVDVVGDALAQDDLGARGDRGVGRGQGAVHPLNIGSTVKCIE